MRLNQRFPNTLQQDADELAEKNGYSSPSSGVKQDITQFILKGNPSVNKAELKNMSTSDLQKLIYNSYRQQGKSMSEARELAEKTPIPCLR